MFSKNLVSLPGVTIIGCA